MKGKKQPGIIRLSISLYRQYINVLYIFWSLSQHCLRVSTLFYHILFLPAIFIVEISASRLYLNVTPLIVPVFSYFPLLST